MQQQFLFMFKFSFCFVLLRCLIRGLNLCLSLCKFFAIESLQRLLLLIPCIFDLLEFCLDLLQLSVVVLNVCNHVVANLLQRAFDHCVHSLLAHSVSLVECSALSARSAHCRLSHQRRVILDQRAGTLVGGRWLLHCSAFVSLCSVLRTKS